MFGNLCIILRKDIIVYRITAMFINLSYLTAPFYCYIGVVNVCYF